MPLIARSLAIVSVALLSLTAASAQTHWVGTWGTSAAPQYPETQLQAKKLVFADQTIREIVHTSIGGDTVRVRLSNAYGSHTVQIGAVHIALRASGSSIVAGSDRIVTFSGRKSVAIPANAPELSDPVKLTFPANGDLAISIYIPKSAPGSGIHYDARQTNYIGKGDLTSAVSIPDAETINSWVFLTEVDVVAPENTSTIVAFGDSITDGYASTVDGNGRWPNVLAERLLAAHRQPEIAVVDEGIGGNRILHDAYGNVAFGTNALSRFGRDAIAEPGVKYVIVLEGINDIGHAGSSAPESQYVSADDIVAGLKQLIARAHEHGLKIFGGTLTPFAGTIYKGYFSPKKEVEREAVNRWIRTSHAFDGVIDFDRAVRDPQHPDRMLPSYDSGDHLHPNDAGYKAMANAIDLAWFR